ncbi:MAG: alpha-amylase [Chlorobi bacterium]|nr:alpha-amylase [Chlorobiota bacterium]
MLKRIKLIGSILILLLAFACQPYTNHVQVNQEEWLKDAVIYEVNVRQYTPEGTFNAFAKHLPRLKKLGVDILWLMPIHPISKVKRKGSLGSYYSVADYKKINPEFGSLDDFKALVSKSHEMGFKVIIDWVANHTGWDNPWIFEHPEWYTTDSTGAIISPDPGWTDVADLNFDQPAMRRAMINAMDYWLEETDIDGFRCDVAWGVPLDFWEKARASFDSIKPVFMLAEDEDHPEFLNKAFNSNYAWHLHHIMNEVAQGKKDATSISDYFNELGNKYPAGAFPMQFITNHDENSWQGTIEERMGKAGDAFAVFSFTIPGIPLIYSGQEAGLDKRLAFFEKDTIDWGNLKKQDFYHNLIQLKKENQALWNGEYGGGIEFLKTTKPEKLLAYKRVKNGNTVLVVLNLSDGQIEGDVTLGKTQKYKQFFNAKKISLGGNAKFEMNPWDYLIFVKK